jgi:hypothetical protein
MSLTGTSLRIATLALLSFGAGSAISGPAEADAIRTRFEVFGFAGVEVLTLHSRTEESGGGYAITVDYATEGIASVFVNLASHAQVRGRRAGVTAQPEWFDKETRRNGEDRVNRVVYRRDGTADGSSTPALPDPVTPAETRGTVDNLTAYFRLQLQLARTGRCAVTDRVFDGRYRYDLIFTDAGRQKLTPSGGQNFTGEAIGCHMKRRSLGQGIPEAERDEGARSGTIWYARLVPGDLLVPVRMRLETQLGTVHGYLAELHGSGVNRTMME